MMALTDLVLKAQINMELIRDPRVSALHTHIQVQNGIVTLTGDADQTSECLAAEEIARRCPGVLGVRNEMTCGLTRQSDTVELLKLRLIEKLDEAWHTLPDQTARTQANYLRWALWLIHKFRIPAHLESETHARQELEITELALTHIGEFLQIPRALIWLEMERQVGSGMPPPSSPSVVASEENTAS